MGRGPEGPWAPSGPKGNVYTQRKLFRMLKSLKFRKGVKIAHSCHVSCRILGVLLSHTCIIEVGPKKASLLHVQAPHLQGQACVHLDVDRASAGTALNCNSCNGRYSSLCEVSFECCELRAGASYTCVCVHRLVECILFNIVNGVKLPDGFKRNGSRLKEAHLRSFFLFHYCA